MFTFFELPNNKSKKNQKKKPHTQDKKVDDDAFYQILTILQLKRRRRIERRIPRVCWEEETWKEDGASGRKHALSER